MDLSMPHLSIEALEYRHKKFDHIRSSPITIQQATPIAAPLVAYPQSLAGTPNSYITNSIGNIDNNREIIPRNTEYPIHIDDVQIPKTPTRRRRTLTASSKSKRKTNNPLCNAPKKRKFEYDPRPTTPVPSIDDDDVDIPSLMPKISQDTLNRICQYNKNMVRKFPKKERTPKDQERRDKNTVACRMSRRLKKLENLAIEEQYKIFAKQHLEQYKQSLHAAVYLNGLMEFGCKVKPNPENNKIVETFGKKMNLKNLEKIPLTSKVQQKEIKQENVQFDDQYQEPRLSYPEPERIHEAQDISLEEYQYRLNGKKEYPTEDHINQENQAKIFRSQNTSTKGCQPFLNQFTEYRDRENQSLIAQDELKPLEKRSFTIAYILGPQ